MTTLTMDSNEKYKSFIEKTINLGYWSMRDISKTQIWPEFQAMSAQDHIGLAFALIDWKDKPTRPNYFSTEFVRMAILTAILRQKLPWSSDDLIRLTTWYVETYEPRWSWSGFGLFLKVLEEHLKNHALIESLEAQIGDLLTRVDTYPIGLKSREYSAKLKSFLGEQVNTFPLTLGEAWTDAALTELQSLDEKPRQNWLELFKHLVTAKGSSPSGKWLKAAAPLVEKIGWPLVITHLSNWFVLAEQPRTQPRSVYQAMPDYSMGDINSEILKALVWLCALQNDPQLARTLTALTYTAYRKIPGHGPRNAKIGNACLWVLGNQLGQAGIAQLAIIKARIKGTSVQKVIEKTLSQAAKRAGLTPEEIEEMSVPTYELETVGEHKRILGDFTALLKATNTHTVELHWSQTNGKSPKSAPKEIKLSHPLDLKELNQTIKDLRAMLPAQRDRIENLYLQQKKWTYQIWSERYLNHPVVGVLARRLIWKFSTGDKAVSGIWYSEQIVDCNGKALEWLTDTTQVELWHPLEVSTEVVLAWRNWLSQHEIQQPFKQAHREIYVLTDAERTTQVYSNRFAAHIVRQHQFNSLCAARGWKNKLRLMVDDSYPPASRFLSIWGLRAEYWIEGAGDEYGRDTNAAGSYLYLATDQVRFYHLNAETNSAHASGGGYLVPRNANAEHQPLELETIPPLVFSEIMRDVDLFVGVASIGNDPTWADGGTNQRHLDYWRDFSFGDLSETAKTRKDILSQILPSLKIASRCTLDDKFLIVRGDIRTYKIHLGSGNILMEPSNQYLCIVPARGTGDGDTVQNVFLPFEGDRTLAVILSKALLLSADQKITDPTILRQIGR